MVRASIIMPVKNGEKYIEQALQSLFANISAADEIIVINDGSTDTTDTLASKALDAHSNSTILQESGVGPARARNAGISRARGEFITFIDHDDVWPLGRLEHHLAIFRESPTTDVVVGRTQYFSSEAQSLEKFRFLADDNAVHHVHLGASTFKKSVFDAVGSFSGQLLFSEDHDLFLRIRENQLNLHFDPAISLQYRIHTTNMTLNKTIEDLELLKVLHESIKRRRSENKLNVDIRHFGS